MRYWAVAILGAALQVPVDRVDGCPGSCRTAGLVLKARGLGCRANITRTAAGCLTADRLPGPWGGARVGDLDGIRLVAIGWGEVIGVGGRRRETCRHEQ
jgi:hypothetical protein